MSHLPGPCTVHSGAAACSVAPSLSQPDLGPLSCSLAMSVVSTAIPEILVIEPKVFADARGFFYKIFNQKAFNQAWIPAGFAHGFMVSSDAAEFLYKTTHYYAPAYERCIAWNDPDIGIQWPLTAQPSLSAKDQQGWRCARLRRFEG